MDGYYGMTGAIVGVVLGNILVAYGSHAVNNLPVSA